MKERFVEDLRSGQSLKDVFLVHERDFRQARNGSHYISLVLGDRTGRVNARKWDAKREEYDAILDEDFLVVRGRVETYKSQLQLIVQSAWPARDEEVDLGAFLPRAPRDPGEMLAELRGLLDTIEDKDVAALVSSFLDDPATREAFCRAPAAVKLHHAYLGGLLEHTLGMARAAAALAEVYPEVDRDLLLAGVLFHDAGKMEELSASPRLAYTDGGHLLGHIHMGARMVEDRIRGLPGFPEEKGLRLVHMILAHHGQHDYGSPKLPMTLEAIVLHYLDNLDAKAKIFGEAAAKARAEGSAWTEWLHHMERRLFAGSGDEE